MRILHVIPSLSPTQGGPSAALPLMERSLTSASLSVETVTTNDDGPGKRNGKQLEIPLRENGVVRRYFEKVTEFYKVSPRLGRWLRREVKNYDLIHIHALFSHSSVAAARAARVAGVPYIIRPLGVLGRYGMTKRRALLKHLSFRWQEGPLLLDAAAVHFTSEVERREAECLGVPFRSVVIPLGLDTIDFSSDHGSKESVILFLSRIDPKKNLEGLFEAWASLTSEFTSWGLVVAGDGDLKYLRQLRELSVKLGISDRLRWVGRVENSVKESLLRRSMIYVLPSFSENFGIAAAEAMGAGLPCVLGEGVAVGYEAARRGGCLLTAPTVEAIRENLRVLLLDAELRNRLGDTGRAFVIGEYGVEVMGRRLHSLYKEILGRSAR